MIPQLAPGQDFLSGFQRACHLASPIDHVFVLRRVACAYDSTSIRKRGHGDRSFDRSRIIGVSGLVCYFTSVCAWSLRAGRQSTAFKKNVWVVLWIVLQTVAAFAVCLALFLDRACVGEFWSRRITFWAFLIWDGCVAWILIAALEWIPKVTQGWRESLCRQNV